MITLTPPHLSPDNVDQHITCIRPKRSGGARIQQERLANKLIIHNYGHGGFGWTLLPGSVLHALSLLQEAIKHDPALTNPKKITVVGAGCMGLLTAIFLHEQGWDVTIIAEQTEQLTSHKAAGSLAVIAIKSSLENQALMNQVAIDSYVFYKNLARTPNPRFPGVTALPAYMIHEGTPDYRYPLITAGVMAQPEDVVVNFGNDVTYNAKKFDTFFLDTIVLMQAFTNKVLTYNIPIVKKKITNIAEIETTIIFNCSGLGARAWDAKAIVPVQGHLVRVKNQPQAAFDYIIFAHIKIDGKLREISWTPKDGGLLGGSAINYEDRLDTNAHVGDEIMVRARKFFGGR